MGPEVASMLNALADHETYLEVPEKLADLFARMWVKERYGAVPRALQPWCDTVRADVAEGRTRRRLCVVSEPLSDYQRWCFEATNGFKVEAGEDLRWVPRRLTSTLALPGNDFWLLDGEAVIFNVFDGSDIRSEIQLCRDPDVIKFCTDAFAALWAVSIHHRDYKPA